MSVVILGMEIPEHCGECGIEFCTKWINHDARTRPKDCPLRPLPEKHGRLIDADAFKTMCREAVRDIRDEVFLPQDIEKVRVLSEVTENLCLDLDEAPTIVEAEGKDDD